MKPDSEKRKKALITGASYGIGYELAKVFAQNDHDLIIVARTESRLIEVKSELEAQYGIRCTTISCDLVKSNELDRLCKTLDETEVEVLVNNAGFGDWGYFHTRDWEKTSDILDLNVKALTKLTHFFLPKMISRKSGKILNIASTAGFQPIPIFSVYSATKAYVIHFSEAIAEEVREHGVQVTVLCPGPTETRFKDVAEMSESNIFKNWTLADPKEVALHGYKSLIKGESVVVHGTFNSLLMQANRIVPRFLAAQIAKKLQGNPKH